MTGNARFTPGEKQATPNRNAALMPVRDWQADWDYAPVNQTRDPDNRNAALAGGYPGKRPELVANHALLQRSEALRAKDMDTFVRHWLGDARSQADWDRLMAQFTSRYGVALPRQFQAYSPEVARQLHLGGLPLVLHLVVLNHRHALEGARQAALAGQAGRAAQVRPQVRQGLGLYRAAEDQSATGGMPPNRTSTAQGTPPQIMVPVEETLTGQALARIASSRQPPRPDMAKPPRDIVNAKAAMAQGRHVRMVRQRLLATGWSQADLEKWGI